VSRRGTTAWIPGAAFRGGEPPVWLSLDGKSTQTSIGANMNLFQIALSRDGRSVAFAAGGVGPLGDPTTGPGPAGPSAPGRDIWVAELERQTATRLSLNENADSPTWTPDGRRVAYRRVRRTIDAADESEQIVWRPADGSGEATVLYEEKGVQFSVSSFSPDGRYLAFSRTREGNPDIWVLPIDPTNPARPFQASPFVEGSSSISPDGRWIAYLSRETGDEEIYVRPFPDGAGRWQVSTAGGLEPRWSADGRALFFRVSGGRLMGVKVEQGAVFRASAPALLLEGFLSGPNTKTYGIAPDGQRFLALPFSRVNKVHAVNYADDWPLRARRLLARAK